MSPQQAHPEKPRKKSLPRHGEIDQMALTNVNEEHNGKDGGFTSSAEVKEEFRRACEAQSTEGGAATNGRGGNISTRKLETLDHVVKAIPTDLQLAIQRLQKAKKVWRKLTVREDAKKKMGRRFRRRRPIPT